MIKENIPTRITRRYSGVVDKIEADICVVGSGAAGLSAALEAARAGKEVVLVDAAPTLGGQAVNSIIGTFCGLYSNGPDIVRLTYGIADEILDSLISEGAARYLSARNSIIVQYDENKLSRWIDKTIRAAGITVLLGSIVREAPVLGRRISGLEISTKFGDVHVDAGGFVDASGDATVAWHAGLEVKEPENPIFGTQIVLIEDFDEVAAEEIHRWEMEDRLAEKADEYGLARKDGFVFAFPGHRTALANMTHIPTPLTPIGYANTVFFGRDQAEYLLNFLRTEFPEAYSKARIRTYPAPGVRQSRWIKGKQSLTADDVRGGRIFDDTVARCSWPIELHDDPSKTYWEELGNHHIHAVPLGALLPVGIDNLVAAGRCIDGDTVSLSSVRVMGPCIAMGAAAAHTLILAGEGSTHQIKADELKKKIIDNITRNDLFEG
tara:strand:- start:1432 stop:2739 length:1308 start_codon:yes stop_codon:yes gene_type:complete